MSEKIDVQEMTGCVCQSARQLARQLTLIYDDAIAPSGLTSVQFGVLARLYGLGNKGQAGVALGALAQRVGRHASTVTRDLQPLVKAGLVTFADDSNDRRVRTARITVKGLTAMQKAFPLWRGAQARVRETLGSGAVSDLKRALDQASTALG